MQNWDTTLVLGLTAILIVVILLCKRFGGWGKTWGGAVVAGSFLGVTLVLWQTSKAELPRWFMLTFSILIPAALFVSWRYVQPHHERERERGHSFWLGPARRGARRPAPPPVAETRDEPEA